jgi:hypothetical protein
VLYNNQTSNGFVLLTLTRTLATAELLAVSTIKEKAYSLKPLATYRATPSSGGVSALQVVQGPKEV